MFVNNPARASLIVFALAGMLTFAVISCNGPRTTKLTPQRPRLAVLVVFDQLRGDFPSRWQSLFEEGGFKRITREGAWFKECHYPYANTMTGPGHATFSTGCSPDMHGIIANDWYSRREKRKVNCVSDSTGRGKSPLRLQVPSLGETIHAATGGKGKVVCLSLKDRSAILPAGKCPDALVYWADKDGNFITSDYYGGRMAKWVRDFNSSGFSRQWEGKQWLKSRPDVDYVRWAGFDDVLGEGPETSKSGQGRVFPHPFGKIGNKPGDYYTALANSPMGNEVLLELAKRAIDEEKLGDDEHPDFLSVSFSSNDLIGHTWGPDSQEVLDVTLRSDVVLRQLMEHLDAKVGKDRWVLALTADHGICPLPEVARRRGEDARRLAAEPLVRGAEEMLNNLFGPRDGKAAKGKWIESSISNMVYLNQSRIRERNLKRQDVEKALAVWLAEQPGIHSAWTREQLEGHLPEDEVIGRRVQRSYYGPESGDVTLVLKPGCFFTTYQTGTTHGSPHDYDRHVPLMIIGPGIKPGIREDERVSPEHAAVLLTRALGMAPPAKAVVKVPDTLFEP